MTTFPNPRLLKGGIVPRVPTTAQIPCVIALQYNPDTFTRMLLAQPLWRGSVDERSTISAFEGHSSTVFHASAVWSLAA